MMIIQNDDEADWVSRRVKGKIYLDGGSRFKISASTWKTELHGSYSAKCAEP